MSKTFLKLESYKGTFTKEELEEMFEKVTDKVCRNCENREMCLGEKRVYTYQAMNKNLRAAVEYGAELNIEAEAEIEKPMYPGAKISQGNIGGF